MSSLSAPAGLARRRVLHAAEVAKVLARGASMKVVIIIIMKECISLLSS